MAKLAEIAREYEMPLRGKELVQSRLRWEDWESLRKEAVAAAKVEIRRRRWRGARGGVLPEGYDAEAIANEAIEEMLGKNSRVEIGFTRERLVRELKRLVSQRVRILHGRKEAAAVRNEWDAEPLREGEKPESVLAKLPGEEPNGYDAVVEQEETERLRKVLEAYLNEEPELKGIFDCLWVGIRNPVEIGRRIGMEKGQVIKARKRLDRRLAEFGKQFGGRARKV